MKCQTRSLVVQTAVDLGAGTGKFIPRLLAVGADVMAIEPSGAMRARLMAHFPQLDVRVCHVLA